jgi:hypothetical protein
MVFAGGCVVHKIAQKTFFRVFGAVDTGDYSRCNGRITGQRQIPMSIPMRPSMPISGAPAPVQTRPSRAKQRCRKMVFRPTTQRLYHQENSPVAATAIERRTEQHIRGRFDPVLLKKALFSKGAQGLGKLIGYPAKNRVRLTAILSVVKAGRVYCWLLRWLWYAQSRSRGQTGVDRLINRHRCRECWKHLCTGLQSLRQRRSLPPLSAGEVTRVFGWRVQCSYLRRERCRDDTDQKSAAGFGLGPM